MAENKHTIQELYQWQALPLKLKIRMTQQRIRDWVREFGENGVYVSFSGGKDSTILLHIAREMYPNIKAVFVDTGLEYPEIRKFVRTFDNVDIIRPKMGFKQVVEKYGFPFISKQVSERVYYAKRYLTWYMSQNSLEQTDRQTDRPSDFALSDLLGLRTRAVKTTVKRRELVETIPDDVIMEFIKTGGKGTYKLKELYDALEHDGKPSMLNYYSHWKWMATAPFFISNKCCNVMKKAPVHKYAKETGRKQITAQMACESLLRTQQWIHNGCNAFNNKKPISNPMSFWTEQDVLLYIKTYNIPIASVYGGIVVDYEGMGQVEGQMSLTDFMDATEKEEFELDRPLLKTTGCYGTGCVFCGFGCHLEKGESRFERLKRTHPKHYKAMANIKNSGMNYFEAIDWINEHNGKGKIIRY